MAHTGGTEGSGSSGRRCGARSLPIAAAAPIAPATTAAALRLDCPRRRAIVATTAAAATAAAAAATTTTAASADHAEAASGRDTRRCCRRAAADAWRHNRTAS